MEKILEKINKKEQELRTKVEDSREKFSVIVYELAALEEIKSIVESEVFENDDFNLLEDKIDDMLRDLTTFAYNANFEISLNDFECALRK